MKTTKTAWFVLFKYAAPADMEHYFEQMEAQGWHLNRLTQFNSMCMRFHQSEPHKYKYVVDLQPFPQSDYRTTYQSFGWELVGKMASVFVWRMAYTDKKPEAFTDSQSVHHRSDTFSTVMLILALCMAAMIVILSIWFFAAGGWKEPDGILGYGVTLIILGALIAILLYSRHKVKLNRNR